MAFLKKIHIDANKEYDVFLGEALLEEAGNIILQLKSKCRAVVITDTNVDKHYSKKVMSSLENAGFEALKFVFNAGENSKSAKTFVDILEFLAENKITKSDILVALGGGVVGDITGFCASCYLRGVDFVQIPTTLLSAVDSSVGGKTAINLNAGKNLAGAFYQPLCVICDTDTFKTLEEREISCGYAEIIKYSVLFDNSFFKSLADRNMTTGEIVEKCVCFKRDIVNADEFETGLRRLLNLGHTAGHGVEKLSGFSLNHGESVAVGMVIATKISENLGLCEKNTHKELEKILSLYNLPVKYDVDVKMLYDACLSDKKRKSTTLSVILPKSIGECIIYDVQVQDFYELLKEAL